MKSIVGAGASYGDNLEAGQFGRSHRQLSLPASSRPFAQEAINRKGPKSKEFWENY